MNEWGVGIRTGGWKILKINNREGDDYSVLESVSDCNSSLAQTATFCKSIQTTARHADVIGTHNILKMLLNIIYLCISIHTDVYDI